MARRDERLHQGLFGWLFLVLEVLVILVGIPMGLMVLGATAAYFTRADSLTSFGEVVSGVLVTALILWLLYAFVIVITLVWFGTERVLGWLGHRVASEYFEEVVGKAELPEDAWEDDEATS